MSDSTLDDSFSSTYTTDSTPTTRRDTILPGMNPLLLGGLLAVAAGVFVLSLAVGSVTIPLDDIARVLLGGEAEKTSWTNIILKIRLPKTITAALAGAALGISGLMMQTYFRNPLAGPFILGVSSGASLGVALVVLSVGTVGGTLIAGFGLTGDLLLTFAAALGAGITLVIVLLVAQRVGDSMTLLILGVMFAQLTAALVTLLLHFAVTERIQAYVNWTFGSFTGVTWDQMPILAGAVIPALLASLLLTKPLNALLLGEGYARSMGLDIRRARLLIVSATAVLAGAITAFCGPIGFIGIAVPHLCRALFSTSDHRILVPSTMLMGALIAMFAGIVAEVPGSNATLPLNAVTALIGSPVVVMVILRQRGVKRTFAA